MSRNSYRKCAKCGKTRAEDMTVTYHRFPNPGVGNMAKALAWAKYCWPNEDLSSLKVLQSIYKKNKVLYSGHFDDSRFCDNKRQKLNKFAVPQYTEVEELFENSENRCSQNMKPLTGMELTPKAPLRGIENIPLEHSDMEIQPSTSREQNFLGVPSTSKTTYAEQITPIKITKKDAQPSQSKRLSVQNRAVLEAINATKLSEMSSREIKLYNVCKRKVREIIRLRNQLKNKKIDEKNTEDDNVQKFCNLNISNSFVNKLF